MPRLPTYSRGSSVQQFVFVNGRPVLDRMLLGALRVAYFDFLSRDRHPAAVLNLICDPERVDVNVHPAKSEVRFREPEAARSLIITGLKTALSGAGHRASSTVADATLAAMRPEVRVYQMDRTWQAGPSQGALGRSFAFQAPGFAEAPAARVEPVAEVEAGPLGAARAQVHENYIIAQTATGMVIVDQHAAHERLVYERLKRQMAEAGIKAQALLIPEIVDLSPTDAARVLEAADDLARMGLVIEPFGGSAVAVREVPGDFGHGVGGGAAARCAGRIGRSGAIGHGAGADGCDPEPDGVSWVDPVGPPDAGRGDERPAARDGGDAAFGPVQPRAADLCGAEAG